MKYFTRGWIDGEYSDEESERITASYWEHVRALSTQFTPGVARLANDVGLHDAIIQRVRLQSGGRLSLQLVCSIPETGCCDVQLRYSGVQIGDSYVQVLRDRSRDRDTCILESEVDIDSRRTYVHRMLFWPEGEISIWFKNVVVDKARRRDWRVLLNGYFIDDRASRKVSQRRPTGK